MKKVIILVLLLTTLTTGCFKRDKYELIVYPEAGDYTNHIFIGTYEDVNIARDTADEVLQKYPKGEYEIGKNLKRITSTGSRIYEETLE